MALLVYLRADAAERVMASLLLGTFDRMVANLLKVRPSSPSAMIHHRHTWIWNNWLGVSGRVVAAGCVVAVVLNILQLGA